ncbi:Clavaminate synthase-like protein [Epithele typhae]|uniref:Clavaminate synthase-like protein n=1 Tax=Epithele typhae TaxID=378194 RepID=UPI00200800B9|nr:Clavaminate synthase-like protein [Epithele typhae]KAH9919967.1 Clavaminate synthase-like protein [Epithele typhae]
MRLLRGTRCHHARRIYSPLLPLRRTYAISAAPPSQGERFIPLKTTSIQHAPSEVKTSPTAFLEHVRSPTSGPLLFKGGIGDEGLPRSSENSRADTLLKALRADGDRRVEVEVGRYDRPESGSAGGRFEVPLGVYLDWMTSAAPAEKEQAQLYLAQWRACEEVPGLSEMVRRPGVLAALLGQGSVDLYQESFFVGRGATVTPIHRDPYHNVFSLLASSAPDAHGKHFLIFPPSMNEVLTDATFSRNTARLDVVLRRTPGAMDGFDAVLDANSAPRRVSEAVLDNGGALSCVLREGDTLFIPRGWWHRVENVEVDGNSGPKAEDHEKRKGWTAGVGWWFLSRSE